MPEAYIVEAKRLATGRRRGGLAAEHPADLGAAILKAVVGDSIPADAVEDVIFGCLDAVGPQAGDVARTCWLAAGLPDHVPGVTIDRQCGSSQQAVHFAAQAVMSGTQDLVVAGGVQNMSMIPISYAMIAARELGHSDPFTGSRGWVDRYGTELVSQFKSAEMIAHKWGLSREDLERFALRSHQLAAQAREQGRFDREIVPYITADGATVASDEGIRPGTTMEAMAQLKTVVENGRHSAAACSQISDGAAALVLASERAVKEHGLTPRARIHHLSVRADDPIWILTAPIPATQHALKKAGMTWDDIDLVEINEAFASVVLAWQKETGCPLDKVNVNGGAIALGHPLGATGAILLGTLLDELEREGLGVGVATLCIGGGMGIATVLERLG